MIPLKSESDLQVLRASGKILSRVMQKLKDAVRSGITTAEIDNLAADFIQAENARSAFKGYRGYPAHVCTSINEEIVHGIPGNRVLKDTDIISLDIGIDFKGYFSDAAITLAVGKIDPLTKKLIEVTKTALDEGIKQAKTGNHLSDISHAIQSYVERNGFSVVREFVGHGIGFKLHEEPEIPNFGQPGEGPILKKGMVLAIEPMVNLGRWESEILTNGWTAITKDNLPSAHFEHTVAITDKGAEILTN
ncbi:MAG: type I methionyl aminopeptidase [Candidatus Omnitrophica bacterium]|nr:type I methionyl aminopeptidase [Candidatus Omnitrophota bacterium]